jgi:class 3 adenylate cyclase
MFMGIYTIKTAFVLAENQLIMPDFTATQALKRFLLSLAAALVTAAILIYVLAGPRLGPHYDFLLRYRPAPPLAHELVLIETGPDPGAYIVEPAALTSVLMACIEMDASALVLQSPVLGLSSGGGGSAKEALLDRFDEEFSLLEGNIRNLFRAIQLGSVPPEEAGRYVGDLVGLSERGKERLIAALEQQDQADILVMEKAAAAYGSLWEAGDLSFPEARVQDLLLAEEGDAFFHYGKGRPDQDGVFRRIAPVLTGEAGTEHIVYALLKQRYDQAVIGETETGPALLLAKNGENIFLPLDDRGALLPELPREEDFRRLPLSRFLDYERQDMEFYRLLAAAEAQGFCEKLAPEDYPAAWYQYAGELREEMLEEPVMENRLRWLDARRGYLERVDQFIYGPSEERLIAEYERLIASETLEGTAGVGAAVSKRNDLIERFKELRERCEEFKAGREELRAALAASLGILGPPPVPGSKTPSDAEISAILANTILMGRALVPQAGKYILICALAAALITALFLCRMKPSSAFFTGIVLIVLAGVFFSWGFILTGYWLDPLIPSGAMTASMAVSCVSGVQIRRRQAKRLERAYESAIAPVYLHEVVRAGSPLPHEIIKTKAGIVAIRGAGLTAFESREDPRESALRLARFRQKVAELFKNAGATLAGFDGDLALAVFGSPLERAALQSMNQEMLYEDDIRARGGNQTPIAKAAGFITELLRTSPEAASWYFGLDTGEAAFSYSLITGYTVSGPPVVRARILSSLGPRYKARVIITGRVYEKIEAMPIRRLDMLSDKTANTREPFYELIIKSCPPR